MASTIPAAATPLPAASGTACRPLITATLGLEGWDNLEPAILAALVSRDPLLLVGRHGCAKSFLLERLAEALGLSFRFYNASLVNYDDLVGIPVPNAEKTRLQYITHPSAIWEAEVVFLDEINRTRPDLQNKLFSIIHERRVQGIPLERLVYRWAAMNPPPPEEEAEDAYIGTEPLDPALVDRFALILQVPDWSALGTAAQRRVLADTFGGRREWALPLSEIVASARRRYQRLQEAHPPSLHDYLIQLAGQQASSGNMWSTRRMTMLLRNILAVHAARQELATGSSTPRWEDSAWLGVLHGQPQLAHKGRIDTALLLAAHRHAWQVAALEADDPMRMLLGIADPVQRLRHGLRMDPPLAPDNLSVLCLDAVAATQPEAHRTALALVLYLALQQAPPVNATVHETLATSVQRILQPCQRVESVINANVQACRDAAKFLSTIPWDDPSSPDHLNARYTYNLVQSLLPEGLQGTSVEATAKVFSCWWDEFGLAAASGAEASG